MIKLNKRASEGDVTESQRRKKVVTGYKSRAVCGTWGTYEGVWLGRMLSGPSEVSTESPHKINPSTTCVAKEK